MARKLIAIVTVSFISLVNPSFSVADVVVDVSKVNFGSLVVGSSAERLITIVNLGTDALEDLEIFIANGRRGEFLVDRSDCDSELAAHQSCTVRVMLHPIAPGRKQTLLSIDWQTTYANGLRDLRAEVVLIDGFASN